MEVAWETLVALADHKRGYRASSSLKPEYKIEIWILFPSVGIMWTLALDAETLPDRDVTRATRLFGCQQWRPVVSTGMKFGVLDMGRLGSETMLLAVGFEATAER